MHFNYLKRPLGWIAILGGIYWLCIFLFTTQPALHLAGYGIGSALSFFVARRLLRRGDADANEYSQDKPTVTNEEDMNLKYCVVTERAGYGDTVADPSAFNQAVSSKMDAGWTLQGGVSTMKGLSDQWVLCRHRHKVHNAALRIMPRWPSIS